MKNHIAVLGAGLSGLSSAFHLARLQPNARITLIEKQKTSGGWVRSCRMKLSHDYGSVLLEAGPRTLRPNAQSVMELVNLLDLKKKLITVSKESPAAKVRYLYTPSSGLQKIPSSFLSLLKSPLSRILIPAVALEGLKPNNRPRGVNDESVDSFLRRRFGAQFADTFGSAIIHGIYAADSRKIGIRAAFPSMWEAAERGWGSIVRGLFLPAHKTIQPYDVADVPKLMDGVAVYSFQDGMQTLTDALEGNLRQRLNVDILCDTSVTSIQSNSDGFSVDLSNGRVLPVSHIVSALPTSTLHDLLPCDTNEHELLPLTANPISSVHVVNIVFPGAPSTIHPDGFGYLIPRPAEDYPSDPTGLGMLGTVFDSCSTSAQDSPGANHYTTAKFTKLTVMVGGPYPLPPLPPHLSSADETRYLPKYMQNVLSQLSLHLTRQLPAPLYWRIVPNQMCIPTPSPGHVERVSQLRKYLDTKYKGRMQVVGAGIGGVSLGDCVETGRTAALNLSASN